MKQDSKKRVALATFYTLFVVMLLMGTRCESRVHLTTPERDAKHIAELAESVHSEAELRAVEKLATEYEIAYRKSYGGAKALYFKSLYEPVMDEAGERRAIYRAEEERVAELESQFEASLGDLDLAWKMPLGSHEEELAKIAANDATIAEYDAELQSLVAKKEQLAMDIIDAGYPQDMLDQIGVVEKDIKALEDKIAEVEHTNEIIILANRLQLQRTLDIDTEEVVEEDIAE
ncbi:MAG: hypothetical protein IJZ78_02900 [Alistipes sp.]|nr:hypothetical protein [Alistipes sp.]